jgi:hypothetical protein
MNFVGLGGLFRHIYCFPQHFACRYPRRVGAHPKHPDFREELKTERVLWSALAYELSDEAKKF